MTAKASSRVVVVTGGASGIGECVARQYLAQQARVVVLDMDERRGRRLERAHVPRLRFIACDVTDGRQVQAAFRTVARQFGRIDLLVNNAALQQYKSVADCSEALWDRTMAVNVKGYFLCAKHALPLLRRAPAPVIVNLGSVNSFVSMRRAAAYVTSKAAILGLTRSLAVDYAPWLRCVAVCPGAVDTPALRRDLRQASPTRRRRLLRETESIHLTGKITPAAEVAEFVAYIASARASFATGQAFRIDGGIGVRVEGT